LESKYSAKKFSDSVFIHNNYTKIINDYTISKDIIQCKNKLFAFTTDEDKINQLNKAMKYQKTSIKSWIQSIDTISGDWPVNNEL